MAQWSTKMAPFGTITLNKILSVYGSTHMSHDLGAVTIFRLFEIGLGLALGKDWGYYLV